MSAREQSLPDAPIEKVSLRREVEEKFDAIRGLIKASHRPLPTQTGDGSYIVPPISTGVLKDIDKLGFDDLHTIVGLVKTKVEGSAVDDREYGMEGLASELPSTSKNSATLTNIFVNGLWNDLQHPPLSSLGDDYRYRKADGSNNSVLYPHIGAAGTAYARTVRSQTLQQAALPEPGTLFDSIMVREGFEPHPTKISSMLFYLAAIIIHDLFRTDHHDFNTSLTSSYLDLSPLYGSNENEQTAMRTFIDGRIKPDCFSEKRLLGFPPGVGVMLIMFNRFHNHVVEKLAIINEGDRFNPTTLSGAPNTKRDNDLFQTGRLITCGLYINCILQDYVRTILNLNRVDSTWNLDPRVQETQSLIVTPAAEGVGNRVSVEFNLVYRWHAALSKKDDEWTQQAYKDMFPGRDPTDVTLPELLGVLHQVEANLSDDPLKRPFANLHRGSDDRFPDGKLADILAASIADVAGSFGANRVPRILRSIEILGIKQARSWNLATLNEFRAHFGLKKHQTFESINPDPYVADQLRHLYDHPDLVELYPGLVVEAAKEPKVPGSGLCPSLTVSRAVLADAVALVRGDRFYTIDYTPKNLTQWGFNEANYDRSVDQGCVFYKLILTAFPQHFQPNSVWAHFPLVVPGENEVILTKLGKHNMYNFDKPTIIPAVTLVTSYRASASILSNQENYKVTWGKAIRFLMQNDGKQFGADFMLSGDGAVNAQSRDMMSKALYRDEWYNEVRNFYEKTTLDLLHDHSYQIAGVNQVDIVRDVGNLMQARFAAEVFSLPLKTKENPRGVYAESELYIIMALVFTCIFFDGDPAKSFPLQQGSRKVTQQLGAIMQGLIEPINSSGILGSLIERFHQHSKLSKYGIHMITQLLKSGLGVKDIVWSHILPTAGGMVANQGQLFAQCLDFYLSDEAKPHLQEIHRLAKADTKEADDLILRYFMEGSRIRASVGLYRDVVSPVIIQDGSRTLDLKAGERIMVDLVTASHDPDTFPDPETVRLDRPLDSYIHYGWGPHMCLGYDISKLGMMTMLKTIGRLENLRRAPGPQGHIKRIGLPGGYSLYMTADGASFFPFPTTMKVRWDGELPPRKE